MKKKILILVLVLGVFFLLFFPNMVGATVKEEEQETTSEVDWTTQIPPLCGEQILDHVFKEDTYEPKELYVTTNLNMRVAPSLEAEVVKVLGVNTKVKVVAEYHGWSRIIVDEEKYYVWNEYLSDKEVEITKEFLGNFKLTAYCNCAKCCGKWAGGPTASGKMPKAGCTVAMGDVPMGTKLLINGHIYIVEDRGTPYGHVDIYFNTHSEALQFGKRYADVYKIK